MFVSNKKQLLRSCMHAKSIVHCTHFLDRLSIYFSIYCCFQSTNNVILKIRWAGVEFSSFIQRRIYSKICCISYAVAYILYACGLYGVWGVTSDRLILASGLRPDDVTHCRILSSDKAEWWLIPATHTLQMMTLFPGWPVMVHDPHTRRRSSAEALYVVPSALCPLCPSGCTQVLHAGLLSRQWQAHRYFLQRSTRALVTTHHSLLLWLSSCSILTL